MVPATSCDHLQGCPCAHVMVFGALLIDKCVVVVMEMTSLPHTE